MNSSRPRNNSAYRTLDITQTYILVHTFNNMLHRDLRYAGSYLFRSHNLNKGKITFALRIVTDKQISFFKRAIDIDLIICCNANTAVGNSKMGIIGSTGKEFVG